MSGSFLKSTGPSRWHNGASRTRKTSFDYVALVDQFQQEELSQEELYESSVRPFINRCLQGCSGSIITYGARGSGKSYTLGTLDPQQLSLAARGNGTPGVLSRCTQQLYEWLGEDAAVEVTCVEVQGDDIVDLLEQRPGASAFNKAAATTIDGLNGGPSSTSVAPGCASPVSALSSPQAGFSRSPIAFAAASASSRRKPLTATVVRNLAEALLTLQRAVSNRQVFSTATRHNSSRTHAVFQLRWRNPAAPAATGGCGCVASAVTGAAGYGSCGGAALRPFSAPPRSALTGAPLGSPPPGTRVPDGGGSGGPVCTLTLVDTCSFCPLLPPKEASAVKRSLLALGRVLSALQRRHSMTLRESKLTRMLEGAVDQILLLACMCGVGDESTVQLVKTLQQGSHMRDNALRRSRRASSSDSRQASGAWESAASLCAVSAVSLAGVAGLAQHGVVTGSTADAIGTPPRVLVGKAAGLGPSRALFRSPKSPHGQGYGIQRAAAELTELPLALSTVPSGDGKSSSGGGGTDTDAVAMPPMSESSPGESSSSPAASSRSGGGDGDGASVATSAAVLPLAAAAKAGRPEPLTIDVMSTDTLTLCSPGATGVAAPERRTPLSSGCRRAGSAIPSPPGMSPVGPSASRLSGTLSSRERPASVTARAAPGPEVRRSQGFSVLQGKWSPPPPPVSHANDKTFPIVPCCIASGASATGQSLSLMRTNAAISTDSGVPLAAPGKPAAARGGIGTSGTRGRTSPGRGSLAKSGASSGRGSSGSASALTALSLTAAAKRPSVRASPSVNSATLISLAEVPPTRLTSTRYDNTNASHDSTHEGMATAAASAASALLTEPLADGPSASQIRLSLTLRNQTEGAALGGGAGLAAGARARSASGVSSALSVKRSISSGTRWPSPLLRARRTEWLEDTRRSRSALPRYKGAPGTDCHVGCNEWDPPVTEIPEPQPDSALGPRKPPDGFRCAPMSRPTLSAQYKDLLLDFEASTPQDSARPVSGSCARPPPVFSRAHSPTADEGLLSLTAAAAAAATAGGSPRTAVSVGTPPSGRPRPGVSRGSGAAMSPRLLRSPERPATPVSPTTVLDMSRLFAAKSSPTAAAGTQPPSSQQPGSGRGPRLSAGSARQLASGGSDRYKRMVEDDVDSVRTSEAEGDSEGERAHSDAVSYPSGDSDSDRDNLLGPGGLENLGLMLEAGGSVAALHDSISRQGESSVTSPAGSMATPASQRRTSARSAATATPTSVRICALQAAGARRGYDRRPDEELPAVSFFIPRFTPRGDSSNASPAGVLRSVATAPVATALAAAGTSIAGVSATGAAAQVTSTSAAGSRPRAQTGGTELLTVPVEAAQEAACSGGRQLNAGSGARRTLAPALLCADNQSQPEAQPEYEEAAAELQPRRERVSGAVAAGSAPGAVAAAAAAAVAQLAQLQLLYIARDRVSGSSDVLQGSCTTLPADLDGATACKYSDGGQALPPPSQPEEEEEEENEEEVEEAALQGKPLEGRSGSARASPYRKRQAKPVLSTAVMGKAALGPPSHSSISLRQLLQQQLMQQRPGRRTAGRVAAAIAAAAGPRKGSPKPNSPAQGYTAPTPQAAAGLLAQRAVVRPNHMDLDEHSTVLLVDGDCASESDATVLALAAARAAAAAVPRRASAWGNQVTQAGDAGSAGTAGGVSAAGGDDDVSKTHLVVSGCPPLSAPSVPLPESPFAIRITKRSPRQPPQLPTPSSLSQTSVRERVAALEGVQSPGTAANVPPHHTPSQTMKSWAQEVSGDGGSHSSSCALVSAAVPGGRLGVAQTRSAPSPSATTLTNAVADALQRQAVIAAASRTAAVVIPQPSVRSGSGSGSGTGSGSRSGADHQPYPSLYSPTGTLDSGGGRYGSSPTLPGGAGARCPAMAVAAGLASRPSAATPAVQVARSIDGDPGTHRSTPRQHALQLLPQQQHQQQRPQHHNQSKHQSQQQQQSQFMATLRASGNVAAAWRAAAAKSTSSYSSVRSCFRSNSGQHQHSMLGSDATAVATVVAVSRAAPLGVGEEKHALGRTSGHVAAAAATAAAVKWSGGLEHLPGNGAFTTVLGGGVMPVTGGTTPMAGSSPASPPRLPPHPRGHQSGTTFANRLPSSETYVSKTLPPSNANEAAAVTPAAAAIANPATPAVVTASAAAGLTTPGILAKAKSARGERMTPLTARLWAFKSYRTPRPAVATPVARLGEEEAEPLPPPPAYPPGFVGWATKMFSKSKKNKLASLK
ncbi:hypothetical protein VOLCADRAFT_103979 [Volvox carteri f. nagariensis]|uniref:Kinesin motor domain-containing protein n=1 Tax=Volvox carteri f. nagariensis TaxID=3068 RepID=D8TQG3_VOLCA|nr:uncharacterized protein VOLCADRAFT_103979 [Volvox carteri f. nagariensis]EFJ50400.1 hypothetical protein VOLCADRAFT_103979 [Volvox carteri f. nagariensis]|eukprot:XP_002948525.1 hypothetical protein VOLCADRAFT_103979 [Volvox carteri f. nagariensis]